MTDKAQVARSNRRRGKRIQSKVSKLWEGDNVGTLGGEDVSHKIFSIESKSVKRCIVQKWYGQAQKNAPGDKIPLVHCHIMGDNHNNDYVITSYKDFKTILSWGE